MQLLNKHGHRTAAIVSLTLLGACPSLAACGGSSSPPTKAAQSSSTSSATSTSHSAPQGRPTAARFAAMRICLQKQGVTFPQHPAGARRAPGAAGSPRGGFFLGGARSQLPKGVSAAKLREAFRKCGGGRFGGGPRRGARIKSPVFKQALSKFAACAREHGVTLPPPNSSGNGPVFETKGLDTSSPKFRAAVTKCRSLLSGVIGGDLRRGAPGGGPPTGPPAGAESGAP